MRVASASAFAIAGLVLGHAIAYALAVPDPYHRDLLLTRTGHGYLPVATQLALILAFAATAAAAAYGVIGRSEAVSGGWRAIAARLAIVQVTAFVAQEVVERLATGAPLGDLVREHLLLVGVAAQIVVALAGVAVLRWLSRTSARLAEVCVAPSAVALAPAFALPASNDVRPLRRNARTRAQRAPPLR